ncbi:MAG: hypothetical protein Q8Q18_00245 [bacterium]|nr:hypothetical protein [bacterium]
MISDKKYKYHRLLLWVTLLATSSVLWWSYSAQGRVPDDIMMEKLDDVESNMSAEEPKGVTSSEKKEVTSPVYVAPAPVAKATHTADGKLIIRYTASGFEPAIAEAIAGKEIQFVNESPYPLYVTSQYHPLGSEELIGLDFGYSLNRGETYNYLPNKAGTWGYYNLNKKDHFGTIVISQ